MQDANEYKSVNQFSLSFFLLMPASESLYGSLSIEGRSMLILVNVKLVFSEKKRLAAGHLVFWVT